MSMRAPTLLLVILAAAAACGSDGSSTPNKAVTRVSVTPLSSATDMQPGKTLQLTATATDASGAVVPSTFAWSSSATTIATVDQTGKVTGVAAGQTTIAAAVSGITGTYSLTINPAAAATKDTIFTPGISFSPNFLIITRGTTVIFALGLDGIGHDVRFATVAGAPADIPVSVRAYIPRTFSTAGTFHYICPTHPEMVGDVVVQ